METVRIRDPGWKKIGSRIRDKHPGSITLVKSLLLLVVVFESLFLLVFLGTRCVKVPVFFEYPCFRVRYQWIRLFPIPDPNCLHP